MPAGHILDDVLIHHQFVCRLDRRVKADIDFCLARRRRLVVVFLNGNPDFLHLQDHLATDILLRISGRDRKVAFLVTDFSAQVVAFLPDVPGAFFGIDGRVNAINDVGIGDTMVTSSHDWADLVRRGTPPTESPTVMRTLDDILS